MVFSIARGAVVKMSVGDYYQNGKRWWVRLHEKGRKFHEVQVHHLAEEYIDACIRAAGIADDEKGPLFRSVPSRTKTLTTHPVSSTDGLRMIRRRADHGFS